MSRQEAQARYHNSIKGRNAQDRRFSSIRGRSALILRTISRRAKEKGLDCTIPVSWITERLTKGTCEVSGLRFDISAHRKGCPQFYSPSVDRIDITQGYTPSNCRMVLDGYNRAKGVATDTDVLTLAKALLGVSIG